MMEQQECRRQVATNKKVGKPLYRLIFGHSVKDGFSMLKVKQTGKEDIMDEKRLFVDFHVIQTVPPSCINRDDTGSPKTAVYGGSTRARVSSQAWKHAMRDYFKLSIPKEELGVRTKYVRGKIADEIQKLNGKLSREECENWAGVILGKAAARNKDKGQEKKQEDSYNKEELDTLLYISWEQIRDLAKLVVDTIPEEGELGKEEEKDLKEKAREKLMDNPSFEMILFGRMVATDSSLKYDAAAQVAHSISTHAVHNEYDYFTAVDDLKVGDSSGAGHLGTVEFNSSTLYRYATVSLAAFKEWVGNPAKVIRTFSEAFIYSMPTGKQSTFANRTVPDAVYITIREDQPVNFSGAFEDAVVSRNGFSKPSAERLVEYVKKSYQNFVEVPTYAFGTGECMEKLCDERPMKENLDLLEKYVRELQGNAGEN